MRLLIAGSGSLSRASASHMAPHFIVRVADDLSGPRSEPRSDDGLDRRVGDLRDPDFCAAVVAGCDAVLHLAPIDVPTRAGPASLESDLDRLDRAARGTYRLVTAAVHAGVRRLVVASSLDLFRRIPAGWNVTEAWRPRPDPTADQLAPWIAERTAVECCRWTEIVPSLLRFARIVDPGRTGEPVAPDCVHLDDALEAIRRALVSDATHRCIAGRVFHIGCAGIHAKIPPSRRARRELDYEPRHACADPETGRPQGPNAADPGWETALAPPAPVPGRATRSVVLFGAGGPLGAAVASELADVYRLRLTDRRDIAEIAAEGRPQSPGAPLPRLLAPPHESRMADIADPADACSGMDAIVNCSVVRDDSVEAFRVNALGVYALCRAAVHHRIRRIVQTGPFLLESSAGSDYALDHDLSADAPARPGSDLYLLTKHLGQEIGRAFAEYHDLEFPVLLFCSLTDPSSDRGPMHPFSVSWRDAARAVRCAVDAPNLPAPFDLYHVLATVPHGRYSNRKTREALGWIPRDDLRERWMLR